MQWSDFYTGGPPRSVCWFIEFVGQRMKPRAIEVSGVHWHLNLVLVELGVFGLEGILDVKNSRSMMFSGDYALETVWVKWCSQPTEPPRPARGVC